MQTLRKRPTHKPSKAKINIDIRSNPNHPTWPEFIRVYDNTRRLEEAIYGAKIPAISGASSVRSHSVLAAL